MPNPEVPRLRRDRTSVIVAIGLVCLAAPTLALVVYDIPGDSAARRAPLIWLVATALFGAAVPFLYWAPYRALGIVPYAALAWLLACAHGVYWHEWPGWAHGLLLGLVSGALARGWRGEARVEENYVLIAAVMLGAGIAWGFVVSERPFTPAGYFLLAIAIGLLGWTVTRLFRPLFELTMEPALWLGYSIRARGPGLTDFPRTGPCLVIANHACWLDPIFLAKVLPRPITPMMTARFYDQPVIHRFVVAFGVIRVPEKALKKDTPELAEAIAALDRGDCVVIFPEGYLRRTEDRLLRRFGQGIWQILQSRPDTPVYACWIEGGWGSYMSYFNGPPTKNKKKDLRRPIGVAVSAAANVPHEILIDHLPTRIHLMNLVLAARAELDLPSVPPFELPAKEDAEEDANHGEAEVQSKSEEEQRS
jgi:1-acyl-sn-glycerol-3-phosphate acyltransferase